MYKTFVAKEKDIKRAWLVVDASGQNLGRLASKIATRLRGKHKPIFTPGLDTGDYVIVVTAGKVAVTARRLDEKLYYRHSNYPGGLRAVSLRDQLARHPERVITAAVWGMLPHNKLGKALLKKLKVYAGPDHPHTAQAPQKLE